MSDDARDSEQGPEQRGDEDGLLSRDELLGHLDDPHIWKHHRPQGYKERRLTLPNVLIEAATMLREDAPKVAAWDALKELILAQPDNPHRRAILYGECEVVGDWALYLGDVVKAAGLADTMEEAVIAAYAKLSKVTESDDQ